MSNAHLRYMVESLQSRLDNVEAAQVSSGNYDRLESTNSMNQNRTELTTSHRVSDYSEAIQMPVDDSRRTMPEQCPTTFWQAVPRSCSLF